MEKQLTALPLNSIITEWQQAHSFLYRKYCSIHGQRKQLYWITACELVAFSGVSLKTLGLAVRIEPGNIRLAIAYALRFAIASE